MDLILYKKQSLIMLIKDCFYLIKFYHLLNIKSTVKVLFFYEIIIKIINGKDMKVYKSILLHVFFVFFN